MGIDYKHITGEFVKFRQITLTRWEILELDTNLHLGMIRERTDYLYDVKFQTKEYLAESLIESIEYCDYHYKIIEVSDGKE